MLNKNNNEVKRQGLYKHRKIYVIVLMYEIIGFHSVNETTLSMKCIDISTK